MVYFITDGELIKIGHSEDPRKRLKELQTANGRVLSIRFLFKGRIKAEKGLHVLFKDYRTETNNEWFRIPEDVLIKN